MARKFFDTYQKVYIALKKNPAMISLLEEFDILDEDFKRVCEYLHNNYNLISSYDFKSLYYSATWSTLETDAASPYVRRFETVSQLPKGQFVEDGTVYFVKNPVPGAYYIYNALTESWSIDPGYSETTPTQAADYRQRTGNLLWEPERGYFQLIVKNSKRAWQKLSVDPAPSTVIAGTVVRVADLNVYTANVGDVYHVKGEDLLDSIAMYYGFTSPQYLPPWDTVLSKNGSKLTELLYFTLYDFMYISEDNFYEKNLTSFLPAFDSDQINAKPKMKLFMDSLGKKFDQLEGIVNNLEKIYDLDNCPPELLDYVGQNLGYEREDFSLNDVSFRELLKNIIEIYKVKGTNYSFSFFFKFLGFSINLKEFYFNKDVNNPESFPGATEEKVEHYLTTTNPIKETTTNKIVSHLDQIRNISDFDLEYQALKSAGCTNAIQYMLGRETYNNAEGKYHSNSWTYFKTNLIEYSLSPFLNNVNLSASDNETIKKYIKFLSPTYLFTWINVNLLPWIDSYEITGEDLRTEVSITVGDPRPTPSPWPAHKPGENGVPNHATGVPFVKKTSSDPGFTGPYKDYEDTETYFYVYGSKLEETIPRYPLAKLEIPNSDSQSILSFYDKNATHYVLKQSLLDMLPEHIRNAEIYLRSNGVEFIEMPKMLQINPLAAYETEESYIVDGSYTILDFYDKTATQYVLKQSLSSYELTLAKKLMQTLKRVGDSIRIEITNNMNLGGSDVVGTVLYRNGSTVRQTAHPSYIFGATHKAVSRLGYDNLSVDVKSSLEFNSKSFSSTSFPSLPDNQKPNNGTTSRDSNNVLFSWDRSYGAAGYRIQIARDQKFTDIAERFPVDHTSIISDPYYITTNKLHNNIYYWRISTKNTNDTESIFLDKKTYSFYRARIASKTIDNLDIYPGTLESDKVFFDSCFKNVHLDDDPTKTLIGHRTKDDLTTQQKFDYKNLLFKIGYGWTSWSDVSMIDLNVAPFPYDGEIIDKATKYIVPDQASLTTKIVFEWPTVKFAEFYQIRISSNPAAIEDLDRLESGYGMVAEDSVKPFWPPNISGSTTEYTIGNGTYYWRTRIKHLTFGMRPWSPVYTFTVTLT